MRRPGARARRVGRALLFALCSGLCGTLVGTALAAAPGAPPAGATAQRSTSGAAAPRSAGCTSAPSASNTYTNPIVPCDAPDPDVVAFGTEYYAFATGGAFGHIQLFTSPDLTSWTPDPWPGPLVSEPAWATPGHEWAPDVWQVGGIWIMYYATLDRALGVECISVATSYSIAGPYTDDSSGPLVCQNGIDPRSGLPYGGDIDPQPFRAPSGALYLLWKSNGGTSRAPSYIWAEQLNSTGLDFTPGSSPAIIAGASQAWQRTVIENPDMIWAQGRYYLFFSGGDWYDSSYAVGYALCAGPLGPCAEPSDRPLLASSGQVAGPGGESVFQDPFGQWWMAYSAWSAGSIGYPAGARALRMDPLCFVGGIPVVLGPTVGTAQPLTQHCPTVTRGGYRLVASDGGVFSFGASFHGSAGGTDPGAPIVGMARDEATGGYWLVASDGGVFSFDAPFLGSLAGRYSVSPIVGMAASPGGGGYWLVSSAGQVFAFGDAAYHGSLGSHGSHAPVVGIAVDRWSGGYWLVASDGGVFSFDAPFYGSMGGTHLNAPVVGMAASGGGSGYWLVASDGGVFSFGSAPFLGSMGGTRLNAPVVGMAADAFGAGYWLVASDGGVFGFGSAPFLGSMAGTRLNASVVGLGAG